MVKINFKYHPNVWEQNVFSCKNNGQKAICQCCGKETEYFLALSELSATLVPSIKYETDFITSFPFIVVEELMPTETFSEEKPPSPMLKVKFTLRFTVE